MTKKKSKIPTFEEFCFQSLNGVQGLLIQEDPSRLQEVECAKWIIEKYRPELILGDKAIDIRKYTKEDAIGSYLYKMLNEKKRHTFHLQLSILAHILEKDRLELWLDTELHGRLISYFRYHEFRLRMN